MTPTTGFHVADVLIDGLSVGPMASYTFTNVTANHTIWATFAPTTNPTITPSAGANGTITPGTPQTVVFGANQSFTIAANAGYHVLDVLVDGSSVGPVTSYQFTTVTANHAISATFEVAPTLAITSPNPGAILVAGVATTVSWSSGTAVSVGAFNVWAISRTSGAWNWLGAVNANGTASYSLAWGVGVTPGDYSIVVRYVPPSGPYSEVYMANWFTVQ